MIGNTFIDYLKIRFSITALRLITPASIGYLTLCAVNPRFFCLPLGIYTFLEASFYLVVYLPRYSRLQSPPTYLPLPLSRIQRRLLFDKCVKSGREHLSPEAPYPSGWFLPPGVAPKKEDVIDWLLCVLFSTSRDETNVQEHQEELDGYVAEVEILLGKQFEAGRSSHDVLRSMRVTLDPVVMLHRPLLWYTIVAIVDTYTVLSLALMGFQHYTPQESQWRLSFPPRPILFLFSRPAPLGTVIPYWYRPHRSKTKHPLVFLHGIGIGLYPYIPFVRSILDGDPDVGILVPEMLSISMRMTPRSVPPRTLMLASLNTILESLRDQEASHEGSIREPLLRSQGLGWDSIVLSGHSYGTFVAGWIIRACVDHEADQDASSLSLTRKIAHLILVDPIPILISNPTVAHNFLYRHPESVCPRTGSSSPSKSSQSWYSSPSAWQLWYFASRDADVARTLCRSFFWAEGGVWKAEVGAFLRGSSDAPGVSSQDRATLRKRKMAVVLGGKDQVVPAETIRRYLTREEAWSTHWIGHCDEFAFEDGGDVEDVLPVSRSTNLECDDEATLEVLFNPALDHAKIFDDEADTVPLVEVVRRYVRDQ